VREGTYKKIIACLIAIQLKDFIFKKYFIEKMERELLKILN
jgi:hypothetical protein